MHAVYAHQLATAYADAYDVEHSETAAFARFCRDLPPHIVTNPVALARRAASADFATPDAHRTPYDPISEHDLRAVIAPICAGYRRFTRNQLVLPGVLDMGASA